jgi:hypothetical protein
MSDYDQQLADQVQMEFELEEAFKDLEDGTFLTERQITCCAIAAAMSHLNATNHVKPCHS